MKLIQRFGLIGTNISYSFSKKYFQNKFEKLDLTNYSYEIFDLDNISEIDTVFKIENIAGLNVTIPFKQKIIPYLDNLSDEAEKIGAVNTIAISKGKKTGFNTDAFGFEKTLEKHLKLKQPSALILGDGGAAQAVKYVLQKHQIEFKTISRKSELTFEKLSEQLVREHLLIVQCTPVGTFPNIEDSLPFPFAALTNDHLIIDLIYNPAITSFMKNAINAGATAVNGLYMLEQQAEKAWQIWNFQEK